jgi:hypothetical protein
LTLKTDLVRFTHYTAFTAILVIFLQIYAQTIAISFTFDTCAFTGDAAFAATAF